VNGQFAELGETGRANKAALAEDGFLKVGQAFDKEERRDVRHGKAHEHRTDSSTSECSCYKLTLRGEDL
jgi:hypothetical protein